MRGLFRLLELQLGDCERWSDVQGVLAYVLGCRVHRGDPDSWARETAWVMSFSDPLVALAVGLQTGQPYDRCEVLLPDELRDFAVSIASGLVLAGEDGQRIRAWAVPGIDSEVRGGWVWYTPRGRALDTAEVPAQAWARLPPPMIDEAKLSAARLALRAGGPVHQRRFQARMDLLGSSVATYALLGEWISPGQLECVLIDFAKHHGLDRTEVFVKLETMYETVVRTARRHREL